MFIRFLSIRSLLVILAVVALQCPSWAVSFGKSKKSDGKDPKAAPADTQKKLAALKTALARRPARRSSSIPIRLLARSLALDTDQVKKLEALDAQYRRQGVRKESAVRYARIEIMELFYPSESDLDKIGLKLKEFSMLTDDLRFDETRKLRDARKILNDEQFNKYKKMVLAKLAR